MSGVNYMDNQQGNVQSSPHWTGATSDVRSNSDGSFSIPARALNIIWGNDPRYWEWIELNETDAKEIGFEKASLLQQVNWLEITGKFDIPADKSTNDDLPRSYKVYYVLKFNEDAFGWSHAPIKFKLKLHDDEEGLNHENLNFCENEINLQSYREKPSLWHHVLAGEFTVRKARAILKVEVGMFEVETDWWKGSMILGGIKIEPNYK